MAFFGDSSGFANISSQFHIVHTYESHNTKGEPWKYIMKAAVCIKFQKTTASAPSFINSLDKNSEELSNLKNLSSIN